MTCSTKSSLVPNLAHKHHQKWLRNLVSRSETIVFGTPCNRIISRKNKSATLAASSLLRHGIKCAILENLSTTTNMLSLPFFVRGKPKTKSMDISSHGTLGTGKGMYKP